MVETKVIEKNLSIKDINNIKNLLALYTEVEKAVLFGSRAKGNNRKGSDVDIALFGKNIKTVLWKIRYQLEEETTMPYFFDVVDYSAIKNSELLAHINRVGKIFYKKS